jgi:glycosyltransferase involved in cell wall biosynthesis
MKEVLGDSALYFNGKDVKDMSLAIEKVLDDAEIRGKLVAKGYVQVKKYSWRKMAADTLAIYQGVKL